jgi:hypothetical protein
LLAAVMMALISFGLALLLGGAAATAAKFHHLPHCGRATARA